MEISLAAEKIGHIGSFSVTNSLLTSWIAILVLAVLSLVATKNLQLIPHGIQNVFETIIDFLMGTVDSVIGNIEETRKYFPFLATIFLFIITNNWLGLVPGVGTIGIHEEDKFIPLLRGGNADLNATLGLAIIAVVMVQVFGIKKLGFKTYAGKFFNFTNPIMFFVGILEIISEFSKIISFSFRLFGNIFAGEVLLTIIAMLLPFLGPLPFYALELFVGFIQALVFTMLTLVFIKAAISDHTEEAH